MRDTLRLASRLLGSSLLAQVAVFGAIAVALKSTSPRDFAVYGTVTAVAAVLATFNTLAAEVRVPVVDEHRALKLTHGGWTVVVVVLVIGILAGLVMPLWGFDWREAAILSSLCGAAVGGQQILTGVLLRQLRQGVLARGRVAQGLLNAGLILVLLPTPMPRGILLSLAWGVSVVAGDLVLLAGIDAPRRWCGLGGPGAVRLLAREVRGQPVSNLLVGSVGALPNILLPAVNAWTTAGAWAVVNRFALPVVNTLFNTLQPLFYGRAAELMREEDRTGLDRFHRRWTVWLLAGGIAVLAGVAVGVWWILPVMGESWVVARDAFWPSIVFYPSLFVFLPISQTLVLLGRIDTQLWWTVLRCVVCALPWAFVAYLGPELTLLAYAVASAATAALHLLLQRRAVLRMRAAPPEVLGRTPGAAQPPGL